MSFTIFQAVKSSRVQFKSFGSSSSSMSSNLTWGFFQMRKLFVRSERMSSSSAYVEDAADFAKALTWAEAKSPGDYGPAMERTARAASVSKGLLWRLHYRKPKAIDAADFEKLGRAYEQRGLQRIERARVVPRTALGRLLVRAADALDGAADAVDRSEGGALG